MFDIDSDDEVTKTGRANNQNTKRVREKSAAKVQQYMTDEQQKDPSVQFRQSTTKFVNGIGQKKKISQLNQHMAHAASSKELGELVGGYGQSIMQAKTKKARKSQAKQMSKFVDDFVSSDEDDDEREERGDEINELADDQTSNKRKQEVLSKVYKRVNKTSRNLIGGDDKTNMSIGENRDIPTDQNGKPFEYIDKRMKLVDQHSQNLGINPYQSMMNNGNPVSSTK